MGQTNLGDVARFLLDGGGNVIGLKNSSNTPVTVTNQVFDTVPLLLAETPAANTCAFLSSAAFVGDGAPIAPVPVIYTGSRWAPFGNRQTIFKAQFGTLGSPSRSISGAPAKFTFTNDPAIPLSLVKPGDSLLTTARFQRHGVAAMTLNTYFGKNATYSSNSFATSRSLGATDLSQQEHKSEIIFTSNTAAISTRDLNSNNNVAATMVALSTEIDLAAIEKFFWGASVLTDSADLLSIHIEWISGTYI